jgi:hypothetical protein
MTPSPVPNEEQEAREWLKANRRSLLMGLMQNGSNDGERVAEALAAYKSSALNRPPVHRQRRNKTP